MIICLNLCKIKLIEEIDKKIRNYSHDRLAF